MEQLFYRILRALENQEFIEVKDATNFGSKLPHIRCLGEIVIGYKDKEEPAEEEVTVYVPQKRFWGLWTVIVPKPEKRPCTKLVKVADIGDVEKIIFRETGLNPDNRYVSSEPLNHINYEEFTNFFPAGTPVVVTQGAVAINGYLTQDVFVRDMVRVTEYPFFCRQPHLNEASQPLLPTQGKIA